MKSYLKKSISLIRDRLEKAKVDAEKRAEEYLNKRKTREAAKQEYLELVGQVIIRTFGVRISYMSLSGCELR